MPRRRRRIPPLERRAQQRGNEPRLYPRQPAQRRQPQAYSQPDGNPARPPAPSNRPSCPPLSHISASPGHSPTRHAAIPDEPQASYSTGIETQPLPNPLPECPVQPDPQIKSPEPPDQPHHNCPQQNPCPDPNGSHEQPQTSNASPSQPPKHSKYTQDPEHPSPSEKSSQKNYQKNKFGPAGYSGGCGCIFTCTGVFPHGDRFPGGSGPDRPGSVPASALPALAASPQRHRPHRLALGLLDRHGRLALVLLLGLGLPASGLLHALPEPGAVLAPEPAEVVGHSAPAWLAALAAPHQSAGHQAQPFRRRRCCHTDYHCRLHLSE